MDYTPNWMKETLPANLVDCKTHAHWVAGYWSRALAQLAVQSHTTSQTLSMQQLLAHFLNVNQACLENSNKIGWFADKEMWDTAVEATRRKDPLYDITKHFQQVTKDDVAEGIKAMNGACATGKTPTRKLGKGTGGKAMSSSDPWEKAQPVATQPRLPQPFGKGKGWYKSGKPAGKQYGYNWDGLYGKGKFGPKGKGGKFVPRPKGGKKQQKGEPQAQK